MFLALMKIWCAIRMASHFFVNADVTPNKTQNERLKVAFSSMFLQRKESQRFAASSFFQVSPHTTKKSLCQR